MAFTASNLVQNILNELGQVEANTGIFFATGGSATTFVAGTASSGFGLLENPPEQDIFKNYLAIVVKDAAGAGASPEGKWSVCSAYNDATWTGTIATVTDAIASGDQIMLARQDKFPLNQILFAINRGLESLGDIPANADTTLTTGANQTEYSVPVAVKRGLKQIWIQGRTNDANDNQWYQIYDRRTDPAVGGTASTLYLPQLPSGRTIRLIYDGAHPSIALYSDVISEYVHPRVATCAGVLKLLQWYNRIDANQDSQSYFLWLEQEYANKHLPLALAEFPIQRPYRTPKYSIFGTAKTDRVPDPIT